MGMGVFTIYVILYHYVCTYNIIHMGTVLTEILNNMKISYISKPIRL